MKTRTFPGRLIPPLAALLALAPSTSAASKEKVLYSFQGGTDGAVPSGGVVFDKAGYLYGATVAGGGSGCAPISSCGTAFQLAPPVKQGDPWTETQLHVFTGVTKTAKDGADPSSGLVIDAEGNLYGTTAYGGTGGCVLVGNHGGCGTVYQLTPPKKTGGKWGYKIIYSFRGGKDGDVANGDLVLDAAGNLYGATLFGGGFGSCDAPFYENCGTVFELSPPATKGGQWTEKVLYSFKSGKDGANPNGGLVFDAKGAIYGTSYSGGGTSNCYTDGALGCGTIFRLEPSLIKGRPWKETILHRFKGGTQDTNTPGAGLVWDKDSNLLGTSAGGQNSGGDDGAVFRLAKPRKVGGPWSEDLLRRLSLSNGLSPMASLVFDATGKLFGTATAGASFGGGSVFRLDRTPNGKWDITVLHAFSGTPDGAYSASGLTLDKAGHFYGSTQQGGNTGQPCGNQGCGTVFKVSP